MKRIARQMACVVLLCVAALAIQAQESGTSLIVVERPTVFPDTARERALVEGLLEQAASHASRVYGQVDVQLAWGSPAARRSDYRITVSGVRDESSSTLAFTIAGQGAAAGQQASGIPITQAWEQDLYRAIAQQYYYVWAQARGFPTRSQDDLPIVVDELDMNELVGSTITAAGAGVYPYSIAPMPGGGAVVGAMSLAVHFGADFSVQGLPGRTLLETGNYTSAMSVAATPAGTVVTRPSIGRELFVYRRGAEEPERVRNPLTGQGAMTALPDGRVVLTDLSNQRAAIVDGRERFPLDIYQETWSYIPAIAAGPSDTIWTYDTSIRQIRIFAEDGSFVESISPALPVEEAGGVRAMAVGPTGDALLLTTGGLWKVTHSGVPEWHLSSLDASDNSGLAQMMGVSWDPDLGSIWLVDYLGQRIVQLMEPNGPGGVGARRSDPQRMFAQSIAELTAAAYRAPRAEDRAVHVAEKARLYEQQGAFEMAQAQWQVVVDLDPFHPDALDEIDRLETVLLSREADRLDTRVRALLNQFGRETARADYQRTIRLYEQVLSLAPDAPGVAAAKAALESRFEERDMGPSSDGPLQIAATAEPLFPVLLERYIRDGAGELRLENTGVATIESLVISVEVPGFSTGTTEVDLGASLGPGATRTGPLQLQLGRETLELQEDLSIPIVVSASYRSGGQAFQETLNVPSILHRRSALIWDDSARLASFVTPNEDVVAGFALRSLAGEQQGVANGPLSQIASLSPVLPRAMRIADALGQYGITYVEDPRSPFSEVQGQATAVDTVRFPRTTLYYRSGDCDDTSALLASMYEAAGLSTAIVTTPGHVLIAVDIREPAGNAWMYESETTTVIEHDGTLWMPIETTVVSRGFSSAWEHGSSLVRRHRDAGNVELIPVAGARDRFPSLPLPPSSFVITEPPAGTLDQRTAESAVYTASLLYENSRARLQNDLASRSGSRRIPILNRLGVLHGRFGQAERAREVLEQAISLRSSYVPAFVNLANVELMDNQPEEALNILAEAELLRPESPEILELTARALAAAGRGRDARAYVRRLDDVAPARADALAAILPQSGQAAVGRASQSGDPLENLPPAPWPVED